MTEQDIKQFFDMQEHIEEQGHRIIRAMRRVDYAITKVTSTHPYPPLTFYVNDFELVNDGINFSCIESGQYGYTNGFSQTISMEQVLDPDAEQKILDTIPDRIADAKQKIKDQKLAMQVQNEVDELAEYNRLKEKYDAT